MKAVKYGLNSFVECLRLLITPNDGILGYLHLRSSQHEIVLCRVL